MTRANFEPPLSNSNLLHPPLLRQNPRHVLPSPDPRLHLPPLVLPMGLGLDRQPQPGFIVRGHEAAPEAVQQLFDGLIGTASQWQGPSRTAQSGQYRKKWNEQCYAHCTDSAYIS